VRPGGASGTSCASGTGGALRWTGTQLQLCLPGRDWVDIDRVEGGDIVKAGGTRTWADGTVPTSCLGYKNPEYPKTYTGHTGSGIYRIDPPGVTAAYDVWCEMEIADGGWTYVTDNNHGSASPTNPSATFSEVAGGYHDYEYNLRGNTYDEILVIRASDAVWCNSWGTGGARWVGGGSSMGIAYDTSFYHYNSGDVGYNWIRQPYSISTTCSSCWTTNNTTPSDIAVTEIGDNGRIMMFDPPGASNSYLYVGNFDAFISQAGGCNLPSGGRATWATYVR
jgi:hypothetical protein